MSNALTCTALVTYCAALLFFWLLNLGCDTLGLYLSLPLRLVLAVPVAALGVLISYLFRRVHHLELQVAHLTQRLEQLKESRPS